MIKNNFREGELRTGDDFSNSLLTCPVQTCFWIGKWSTKTKTKTKTKFERNLTHKQPSKPILDSKKTIPRNFKRRFLN